MNEKDQAPKNNENMIEVPDFVKRSVGEVAVVDPNAVAARINEDLKNRDPNLPAPIVQAGDHGMKTH